MKPEQQRIAIAEWCGIRRIPSSIGPVWVGPGCNNLPVPPDYLNDLNAIVGVLRDKVCGDADLEKDFIKHLNTILDCRSDDDGGPVVCEWEMVQITAPADEFCEALLRTIGRWEEE